MPPLGESKSVSVSHSTKLHKVAYVARDEAAVLRNTVCELRVRLEEVEYERNYVSAKANELEKLINSFKQDHVHEELVKKSLQLAELSMTLDSLRTQIKSLKDERDQVAIARENDKKKMEEMSQLVRTLQSNCLDDDESDDDDEVMTPEKAVSMTMRHMKAQIEFLEDEHQNVMIKSRDQENTITQLEKDNEMKGVKIEILEELFRALNDQRQHEESVVTEPPRTRHLNAALRRRERGTRPDIQKANSWAGLMKKDGNIEGNGNRERNLSRRPRYTEGLRNRDEEPTSTVASSGKRKNIAVCVEGQEGSYVGPIVAGKPNGVGTIRFVNGDTYLGEVLDGKLHGKGTLYRKSGLSQGVFENNLLLR